MTNPIEEAENFNATVLDTWDDPAVVTANAATNAVYLDTVDNAAHRNYPPITMSFSPKRARKLAKALKRAADLVDQARDTGHKPWKGRNTHTDDDGSVWYECDNGDYWCGEDPRYDYVVGSWSLVDLQKVFG